jgi:hypothetical protein
MLATLIANFDNILSGWYVNIQINTYYLHIHIFIKHLPIKYLDTYYIV